MRKKIIKNKNLDIMHTAYFIDNTAQPVEQYLGEVYNGDIQSLIDNEGFTLGEDSEANLYISKSFAGEAQDIFSNGLPLLKTNFIPPSIPVKP